MSFWNEIAKKVGYDGGYNAVNFNGKAVCIEGVKKILSVEADKIELVAARSLYTVEGVRLCLEEVGGGCVLIKGEVQCETAQALKK